MTRHTLHTVQPYLGFLLGLETHLFCDRDDCKAIPKLGAFATRHQDFAEKEEKYAAM